LINFIHEGFIIFGKYIVLRHVYSFSIIIYLLVTNNTVIGSGDGTIKKFDWRMIRKKDLEPTFAPLGSGVLNVDVDVDGSLLAAMDFDRNVYLFDYKTGEQLGKAATQYSLSKFLKLDSAHDRLLCSTRNDFGSVMTAFSFTDRENLKRTNVCSIPFDDKDAPSNLQKNEIGM